MDAVVLLAVVLLYSRLDAIQALYLQALYCGFLGLYIRLQALTDTHRNRC